MRAYALRNGAQAPVMEDRPDPSPGPGEALVGLRAVSLNFRDILVASGRYADGAVPEGRVPASDGAGEVLAVGPGVTRVKPGDRVAAAFMPDWLDGPLDAAKQDGALGGGSVDGLLRERAVLAQEALVKLPAHLTWEEAATLPCAGVTAWYALFEGAQVRPGQTVLLLGTGGVSIFALQFAKLAGARVIITSSSAAKLDRARALGADAVVDYRAVPDWDRAVLDWTGGLGVDHAVEVGGPGTLNRTLASLRFGGSMALMGVLTGMADRVETGLILHRNIRIQGTYVGSRAMFERMNAAIAQAGLRPVIDRVFPFEAAAEAYRHLESGQHFGKVVIALPG